MWVEYRTAPNLMMAEMWKDVLEGDGLPTKILPGWRHIRVGRTGIVQDICPQGS